jgi:hypothetical protein
MCCESYLFNGQRDYCKFVLTLRNGNSGIVGTNHYAVNSLYKLELMKCLYTDRFHKKSSPFTLEICTCNEPNQGNCSFFVSKPLLTICALQ